MAHREIKFLVVLLAAFTPMYTKAPRKIIDGEHASILDFPHQVLLEMRLHHVLKVCGGAIIDTRHILTAAHCCYHKGLLIPHEEFIVITGIDDLRYRSMKNIFRVLRVSPHPNYNRSGQLEADIAILKLNRRILFNERRRPAELPVKRIAGNTEVMLAGWGRRTIHHTGLRTQHLQKFKTTVISLTDCLAHLWQIYPFRLRSTQICTWSERKGSPCKGDSGGPLIYNGVVFGIFSQGTCNSDYPAIFTRVHSYLPWIRRIQRTIHYFRFRPGRKIGPSELSFRCRNCSQSGRYFSSYLGRKYVLPASISKDQI